ncbi:MAG: HIT family protein [Rhodocyclaceae bacterium]|nr:HIT family protein [Rhodocyclaceae bacterium]
MSCPLCHPDDENLLWRDAHCRVIRVDDADHPGYCRVVWHAHVAEMTDLDAAQRDHLMRVVFAAESAMRRCFEPAKINLASLGNMVPHLHWHLIARHADDAQFPDPVWAPRRRASAPRAAVADGDLLAALEDALAQEGIDSCRM